MKDYLFIATKGHVCAIHAKAGEEIWRVKVTNWTDISLMYDDGMVYAAGHGKVVAINAYNGEILWENNLPGLGFHGITLAMKDKSVQRRTVQS